MPAIETYEDSLTAQFHFLHDDGDANAAVTDYGLLTHPYDPRFTYELTTEETDQLNAGSVWSEERLRNKIGSAFLQKSVSDTETVIEAFNIKGANVTINVNGGIGTTDGTVEITLLDPANPTAPFDLTENERLTLVAAERNDLKFFGSTGVDFEADSQVINDQILFTDAHGFEDGDPVVYRSSDGSLVTGLDEDTTYYIVYVDDNTVELSTDSAGNNLVTGARRWKFRGSSSVGLLWNRL